MKDFNNNSCNKKICSTSSSTISWTTPVNITKAGFAHPYEILVPDQCYRIRGLETIGTNSIHPLCGHCCGSDTLTIYGNTDICGNAHISGKLTVDGLIDPTGLVLDEQASAPFDSTNTSKGLIWVKSEDRGLYYNDSNGNSIKLSGIDAVSTSNAVLLTGNQTVSGLKTFSNTISGNLTGNATTVTKGAQRDASINLLEVSKVVIDTSVNFLEASSAKYDVSINLLDTSANIYEASLNAIDTSKQDSITTGDGLSFTGSTLNAEVTQGELDKKADKTYVDGSLNTLNTRADTLDASAVIYEASLNAIDTSLTQHDSRLDTLESGGGGGSASSGVQVHLNASQTITTANAVIVYSTVPDINIFPSIFTIKEDYIQVNSNMKAYISYEIAIDKGQDNENYILYELQKAPAGTLNWAPIPNSIKQVGFPSKTPEYVSSHSSCIVNITSGERIRCVIKKVGTSSHTISVINSENGSTTLSIHDLFGGEPGPAADTSVLDTSVNRLEVSSAKHDASINVLESSVTIIDSSLNTLKTSINLNTAKISYTAADAVAANTAKISYTAADAVAANTAKISYTAADAVTANTAKISYTAADAVTANTAKISYTAADAVTANTAKISYTAADAVTANTAKISYTAADAVAANTAKISYTAADAVTANTAKISYTAADAVAANTAKISYTAADAVAANTAKISYTAADAVAANTAKISYTAADAVTANTAKISYTAGDAVATNTAKISYTAADAVTANTAKISYTAGDAVATNTAKISYTAADAVAANTAKISYTAGDAVAANTAKISYTAADAVATNTAKISYTAGDAVAANTAKISYTAADAVAANTANINLKANIVNPTLKGIITIPESIAIGERAANYGIGASTITMGKNSGLNNDAGYNVIIGHESQQSAAQTAQSIWIGYYCGAYTSSNDSGSTVIGTYAAGTPGQPVGQYNTWLGYKVGAGLKEQKNRTIVLNASHLPLLPLVNESFFVKPIRDAAPSKTVYGLHYNPESGEVMYSGAKNFVIPHPEIKYKNQYLRHVCIEAPTRGTNIYEYQFTVETDNQKTKIELPSYFSLLNERPRVYVSAVNVFSHAYGDVNKERTHAYIHTEKAGTFNVLVTGVRKDPMAIQYSNGKSMMDEPIYFKDIPPNTRMNC